MEQELDFRAEHENTNRNTKPMTTAVAPISQKRDIRTLIQSDKVREQIALALPKHMTPDRMTRVALTTINRTPKLLQCTPESLLSGLMLCSQVGLEPDGRNAHLIPYGDQVQVIFDWKGLVALARRNGIKNIAADVVCDGDTFEWFRDADGLKFTHRVDWKAKRGEVYAAYCIWKDGEQFDGEVMTREEIDGIRKRSKAGNNGPWVTDWSEMAKKTVVRRSSKKWPLDPEAASAMNADDDTLRDAPSTRPVFDSPKPVALFAPTIPEEDDNVPMGEPTQNYSKAVSALMKLSRHTEGEVCNYLHAEGQISDETITGLKDLQELAPEALKWAHDNWQVVDAAIKAEKGGAK